jgi:hypothetical protein
LRQSGVNISFTPESLSDCLTGDAKGGPDLAV